MGCTFATRSKETPIEQPSRLGRRAEQHEQVAADDRQHTSGYGNRSIAQGVQRRHAIASAHF